MSSRRPGRALTAGRVVLVALCGVGLSGAVAPAAAEPYRAAGTAITGGDDPGSASALVPGSYVDTLARGASSAGESGSSRYYAFSLRAGQTPYLAATLAPPADPIDPAGVDGTLGVQVTLTTRGDDSSCAQESASDFGSDDRLDPVTAVAAPGPALRSSDTAGDGCREGTVVVRVTRTGEALASDPLRVELAFRLEPAVTATSGLPSAVTSAPELQPDLTGRPAALRSGRSYADAPELGSGIYRDSIAGGDTRIVRIHLDWGQRFAWSLTAAKRAGIDPSDTLAVSVTIRDPLRRPAAQAGSSQHQTFSFGDDDTALRGSTLVPVRYQNRTSDDADAAGYALAGDYYLVVAADVPDSKDTSTGYPYTLQVEISGATQPGPSYASPAAGSAVDPGDAGTGSALPASLVGGGVLVVIAIALAVVALRRGRQRSVHT